MRKTWKRRAGKWLRDLAYWIDPPAKPGRKRKARAVEADGPLLHGWAEEPPLDTFGR